MAAIGGFHLGLAPFDAALVGFLFVSIATSAYFSGASCLRFCRN
jgi:hypothetical protein